MKPLLARTVTVLSAAAVLAALGGSQALAAQADSDPVDPSFTTLDGILLFVGVPLLAAAVITLLVYAPHLARRPRYRPGRPYDGDSLLLGADPVAANETTALPSGSAGGTEPRGGGASAGW